MIVYFILLYSTYKISTGSYRFCIKSRTFNYFIVWIISYLLVYFVNLIMVYPHTSELKYEVAFFQFEFLLSFLILLFLLRIEETGFDYKNAKGVFVPLIIYLVTTTYHNLYMSQISLSNFLNAFHWSSVKKSYASSITVFSFLLFLLTQTIRP